MIRRLALVFLLVAARAEAAVPTLRAVGSVGANVGACDPGLPAGISTDDLLIIFVETRDNEAATATGFTEAIQNSGQSGGAGTGSRVTILYKTAESATPATQVNDSGDHTICRSVAITAGTWDTVTPIHKTASEARNSASGSISITGATTTNADCLVFYASTEEVDPAANGTAECSSMADANLGSVTERIDNVRTAGDGGGLCVGSGTLAVAGATGTWTVTHATSGVGGEAMIAVCAPVATSRRVMVVQ